jgi:2',3'-cyclic-nucleotide 2'-phosphodiesterase (5'-nucleotidase family)
LLKKIFIIALITVSLSVASVSQAQIPRFVPGDGATFDERLGPDDGAALAILFTSDLRGNLDSCECSAPRGGLSRRVGFVEGFKKKFKATRVINVETGDLFYNSVGFPSQVLLQNEQVARAFSLFQMDVVNLSRLDLIYAQKLLAREGLREREVELPVIKNIISANAKLASSVAAPAPYIIKEITGPRIKGRNNKLRVGFVGLAEGSKSGAGNADRLVGNIFEAARQIIPRLRSESDVLVVIAHSQMKTAEQLAGENPQADIVIAADAGGIFKPRQIGNTLVVSIMPGDAQYGDIRVYLDRAGRASFKFRAVDLDDKIPSDNAATAFANEARVERERSKTNH